MRGTSPEFSNNLQAIIKREAIAKSLLEGKGLNETIDTVRKVNLASTVEKLTQKLASQETFLSRETASALDGLQRLIQTEFKNVPHLGLVILGSGAHGGEEVRKLMGTLDEMDLDIGFVFDKNDSVSQDTINIFRDFIESNSQSVTKLKCHPVSFFGPNLASAVEANKLLDTIGSKNEGLSEDGVDQALVYFHPSIPQEYNEKNREIMLKSLKDLYIENPEKWKEITGKLMDRWTFFHRIKPKQLVGKSTAKYQTSQYYSPRIKRRFSRTLRLQEETGKLSRQEMFSPMKELLESTRS